MWLRVAALCHGAVLIMSKIDPKVNVGNTY
jgi:hypothetical protein